MFRNLDRCIIAVRSTVGKKGPSFVRTNFLFVGTCLFTIAILHSLLPRLLSIIHYSCRPIRMIPISSLSSVQQPCTFTLCIAIFHKHHTLRYDHCITTPIHSCTFSTSCFCPISYPFASWNLRHSMSNDSTHCLAWHQSGYPPMDPFFIFIMLSFHISIFKVRK